MKHFRKIITVLLLFVTATAHAQETAGRYKLLLTGASFASPSNTWFETGCESLGAIPVNRAKGGQSIMSTVDMMVEGTLYSQRELEEADALVIMQVHNKDVFVDQEFGLGKKWEDYAVPMGANDYAEAFDYVIKRYMSDCYGLRDDPDSKYYGTESGKPCIIALCTDWHDGRTVYNESVRKLAAKWGLPLVEFDVNIGFSRQTPHPVTGQQISLIYSNDTQTIDGELFGWHPLRGKEQYIQKKMAAIFADKMRQILPIGQ